MSLHEITRRAHQGKIGAIRARRKGPQQRLDGLRLPVERQAERMIGKQSCRIGPVARRLGVPDAVDNLPVLDKPLRGAQVQSRHLRGQRPTQLKPEEIREQVVVTKPRALRIE